MKIFRNSLAYFFQIFNFFLEISKIYVNNKYDKKDELIENGLDFSYIKVSSSNRKKVEKSF